MIKNYYELHPFMSVTPEQRALCCFGVDIDNKLWMPLAFCRNYGFGPEMAFRAAMEDAYTMGPNRIEFTKADWLWEKLGKPVQLGKAIQNIKTSLQQLGVCVL